MTPLLISTIKSLLCHHKSLMSLWPKCLGLDELKKVIRGHQYRAHTLDGGGGYGKAFQMRALNVKAMGAYACGEGRGSKN
jgi:hypothetical protein